MDGTAPVFDAQIPINPLGPTLDNVNMAPPPMAAGNGLGLGGTAAIYQGNPVSLGRILNKPSEYTGKDRAACSTFLAQTKLYINGNANLFPSEEAKVLFAATYLRDKAFQWFEPKMNHPEDPTLHDFEAFCSAMMTALGDPDLKKTMMRKIRSLRQTTSDMHPS